MMGIRAKFWPVLLLILFSQTLLADIQKASQFFLNGQYVDALETLAQLPANDLERNYYEGLCHSRLQNFDQAILSFEKVLKASGQFDDLYYEYGQALYAANQLEKARETFGRSYAKKFKSSVSLYYMGHISQILEDFPRAKAYYEKVIQEEKADLKILQASHFQLAEVLLNLAEKKSEPTRLIKKYVLPQFLKAKKIQEDSALAPEIQRRYDEVRRNYGLDPNILVNGKQLSPKAWEISLTQKIKYDSNVTITADTGTTLATKKDSMVSETGFFGSYRTVFGQRFVITPELSLQNDSYTDRQSPTVYQNDAYTIAPAIRSSTEHTLKSKQAAFLLDYAWTYLAKDREQQKKKIFYNRTHLYSAGEQFNLFAAGPTSIKFKYKKLQSYDTANDNRSKILSIDQTFITSNSQVILMTFEKTGTSGTTTANDTDTTYLRLDWILPDYIKPFSFNFNGSITWTDTLEQAPTRGTEKLYEFGAKASKNVGKYGKVSFSYNYSKNTSLAEDTYAYTKHVSALEFKLSF